MMNQTSNIKSCDKCGRSIPYNKGSIIIDGWIICGICQFEKYDVIYNKQNKDESN